MIEIYNDINNEIKDIARMAWSMAISLKNPIESANFLNSITEYCRNLYTEKEVEFLQFYFNMQMEMMKE